MAAEGTMAAVAALMLVELVEEGVEALGMVNCEEEEEEEMD